MMNLVYIVCVYSLLVIRTKSQFTVGDTQMSFSAAKSWCESKGTTLASIHSQTEQDAALQACTDASGQNSANCWFGLDQSLNWLDGTTKDYGFNSNSPTYQNPPWLGSQRDSRYPCTMLWYGQWWNQKADCNWQGVPICNAAPTPSPTPFTGCNNKGNKDRLLGIRTNAVNQWAGSGSKLFANIYSNGGWDGWRALDNPSCSDFQKGSVDYFDDFQDITSEWEGISLYHCGNDGLLIETLYYWDGTAQKTMNMWYSSVFGPFNQHCLYNDNSKASSTNPLFAYSDIWIKGTDCGCEGVTFRTVGYDGRVWTGTGPGKPNCGASEYGEAPVIPENIPKPSKYAPYINTSSDFEEKLVDYLMTVIGIAALLFVSNSCLITVLVKKNTSNPQYEYGKVYKTDME